MADIQTPAKDPIVHGSLSWHLTVASVVLAFSCVWMVYDEVVTKRPWKSIQRDFVASYTSHLEKVQADAKAFEDGLRDDAELKALQSQIDAADQTAKNDLEETKTQISEIAVPRVAKLTKAMQVVRSEVMALTFKLEHALSQVRSALEEELDKVKNREIVVENLIQFDSSTATETFIYHTLGTALDEAKAYKANHIRHLAKLSTPARKLRTKYEEVMARKRPGLSSVQVAGLIRKMENFNVEIKQIHIPDPIGLVDRCESCHLGIREPLELTAEDLGGSNAAAFISHPTKELLEIHDPEQYGCSPCHGGNGAATISAKEGHGKTKHWLWPMHDRENAEAGCLQCHEGSLVLKYADTLNAGKELFRYRGCWGCHPREGFDTERSLQRQAALAVRAVKDQVEATQFASAKLEEVFDNPDATDSDITQAIAREKEYKLRTSGLESELIELERREVSLGKQLKNVGPSLRPIKSKLRPEWVTQWINNPRAFRPTTRMPVFRLPEAHLKAIAAAVWQAADKPNGEKHPPGDAKHGKELVSVRGCLACHSFEKDAQGNLTGGHFAPELSRLGEKANYDYIVEWVKDTPDWSLMPNLRLSIEDAQDIASYLMTQRDDNATYDTDVSHLIDPTLREQGEAYIRHYGCAGCHDIAGFENVGKIGTNLTTEGNKPIERLDFALHTHAAKRNKHGEHDGIQYSHKSFFQHKLRKPEYFDEGRVLENPLERARMPNFGFNDEQINQLVTYLLGSVDSGLPDALKHHPSGRVKDIINGWWVIKKYNCMGCHQITPDQTPDIQKQPQFSGENLAYAPPSLVGVGARLNPEWLAKFLRNPSMRDDAPNRNGVRTYLQIRMPTFNLWDEEIGALVLFFEAMSNQTLPYFPPHYPDLTKPELALAREAFLSMDCLNCHASGDETTFSRSVIAPSFVHVSERLKPTWTERWLFDPGKLMIDTRMPAGLFKIDGHRKIVAGAMSDDLAAYPGDHIKLFVRYMNRIDLDEAARLKKIKNAEKTAAPALAPAATEEEEFLDDDE